MHPLTHDRLFGLRGTRRICLCLRRGSLFRRHLFLDVIGRVAHPAAHVLADHNGRGIPNRTASFERTPHAADRPAIYPGVTDEVDLFLIWSTTLAPGTQATEVSSRTGISMQSPGHLRCAHRLNKRQQPTIALLDTVMVRPCPSLNGQCLTRPDVRQ